LLITALKDLIQKRLQFSNYFNRLLMGEETSTVKETDGGFKSSFNHNSTKNKRLEWLLNS
jgi:hypothetical protein